MKGGPCPHATPPTAPARTPFRNSALAPASGNSSKLRGNPEPFVGYRGDMLFECNPPSPVLSGDMFQSRVTFLNNRPGSFFWCCVRYLTQFRSKR
jgi:hypothetical protein